jgi:hypothetical protein
MTKIIAFTGIPGTRIKISLNHLKTYIEAQGNRNETVEIISVEDAFKNLIRDKINTDPSIREICGYQVASLPLPTEALIQFWDILSLPLGVIRNIWAEAESVSKVVETIS